MPPRVELARLPAEICFDLKEIYVIVRAVDTARTRAGTVAERSRAAAANRLITRKLWSDLADILQMNGEQDG